MFSGSEAATQPRSAVRPSRINSRPEFRGYAGDGRLGSTEAELLGWG